MSVYGALIEAADQVEEKLSTGLGKGQTRVVSNPRGYTAGHSNPNFDPTLVIEV